MTGSEGLLKQREDTSKLREAVAMLASARRANPRVFELEWRFARSSYFLGKQTTDKAEASTAFTQGRDAGEIASRLDPSRPDGYFWFAANLGELGRMERLTVGITSVPAIRTAMNKVLELQPDYEKTSAYDALALIELEMRMTGGSPEKAVEFLQKGLETEKDNVNLHLHLATAFLALRKNDDARRELDTVLRMKPNPAYLVEYNAAVADARKMLATRF
ncbi:MAG TPA: TRAP transporter TatT component family protein [Pyrinomonadaceae bacterium]|nr:TRAP transporter TatT component family protein [Pyrinomonadaceae bacterium]